jgi:WD40 repeat protein
VLVWDVTTRSGRWVGRELSTRIRHVAWSPDGTRLVGAGDDGVVYVWDALVGTLQQRLPGYQGRVNDVAWSHDGTRLASCGRMRDGGELLVWDMQNGERIHTFAEHAGIVSTVAWGPSRELLVSGDGDGMLRWWDMLSGKCMQVCQTHQGMVQALKVSPDGQTLASCGDDGAITLWNLHSGEHLRTLRRDRPYERLVITGISGVTEAQKTTLRALGAIEDTPVNIAQEAP